MFKKLSLLFLLLSFFSGQVKSQENSCFEIESILVDACAPTEVLYYINFFGLQIPVTGQVEGWNEMLRFKVGQNDLNTADMTVIRWGNKSIPWLGLYGPNDSTAATVAALNASVQTPCGLLVEPVNGVLPANANVLLITSYAVSTVSNSFANLADTLYVLFHNEKNYSGHFLNNNPNPDSASIWQSPVIQFGAECRDSVAYYMPSLVKVDGTIGLEDGARVDFSPDGVPTYVNYGCVALVNTSSAEWASPDTVAPGSGIIHLDSLITGTPGGTWTGEGVENNQIDPALWCGRTLSITYKVFYEVCSTLIEDSLTQSITISANISAAWNAPPQFCSISEPLDLQTLVTGTPNGTWSGEGMSGSVFNPAGMNGEVPVSYKVVDGNCEQTITKNILVVENGNAAWQKPEALCADGGKVGLSQYVTGLAGGQWFGAGVVGDSLNPAGLGDTAIVSYVSGIVPCADTVTQKIPLLQLTAPVVSEPASYCKGTSPASIQATGNTEAVIKWYTDASLETFIQSGSSITPSDSTSSYYAVQSIGDCTSPAGSTSVSFIELPQAPTGNDTVLYCPDTTLPLLQVDAPSEILVVWYSDAALNDSLNAGTSYQATGSNNAFWVVSRDAQCQSTPFKIELVQHPLVEAEISTEGNLVWCSTDSTLLLSSSQTGNTWMPGNTTGSSLMVNQPGIYTLSVAGACNTAQAEITIVDGKASAGFTAAPDSGEAPLTVTIANQSQNAEITSWLLNEHSVTLTNNSTLVIEAEGDYTLMQIVESVEGCRDTISTQIHVKDTKVSLTIPNSFTPNADGYNDVFKVQAKGITEFKGVVFNRWGSKVYEWDDAQSGWDGFYNGSAAPAGVYFYIIKASGKKNTSFEKKGDVTLIR